MFAIWNTQARAASPAHGATTAGLALFPLLAALIALPAAAQDAPPAEEAPAAPDEDDDDDILVDDEDEPPPAPVEKPKVGFAPLVPVGKATKPLAEQVSTALLEEFREARFEVVPFELTPSSDGTAGEIDMDQGQAALKKAGKLLKKGDRLLKRLSFSKAEEAYTGALERLAEAAPALDDVTPVVQAWLGLAEIHARQGHEEQTREALANAVRTNPEYELDPGRYPPLFIRTHGDVRGEVLGEDKGAVVVDGTGKGAKVFFDGRELETAPLLIKGVPAGTHYVRVVGEGIGLFGATVEVGAGDEVSVSPGFFEAGASTPTDKLAQNRFDDTAAKEVAELAKAAGHLGTIIGVVAKSRADIPTALIYVDAQSAMVRHVDVLRFDGDLLNLAIEALKGREEIEKAQAGKTFSMVDTEPLLEGEKGASELEVPSVTLQFEVQAAPKQRSRARRLGGSGGGLDADLDGDDNKSGRRLAASGGSGKRKRIGSLDGEEQDPLKRKTSREKRISSEANDEGGLLTNPWLWTAVAGGAVVAGACVAAGVGVGVYFLIPPTQADIQVNLPGE